MNFLAFSLDTLSLSGHHAEQLFNPGETVDTETLTPSHFLVVEIWHHCGVCGRRFRSGQTATSLVAGRHRSSWHYECLPEKIRNELPPSVDWEAQYNEIRSSIEKYGKVIYE